MAVMKKKIITHYIYNGSSTITELAREMDLSVPTVDVYKRQHLEYLLDNLRERIEAEAVQEVNLQQQRLTLELINSMGQTFCYEIVNMYFANQPMQPLPQNKKDMIFQSFMLALFRVYRKERDVAYYARMQHITPRYFSTIIKEKSGNSADVYKRQLSFSFTCTFNQSL